MHRRARWWVMVSIVCVASLVTGTMSAQQSTRTTETRKFEVISVDGNKVVVRGERGTQEITVPEDFRLTVDGQPVSVHELKPGMKGTATITTTTTVTPVHVTEVKNGEVLQKVGSSIIVRGPKGVQMFSEKDVNARGVKIIRDGQPISITDLNQGDRLTATIVTTMPPKVMTERDVQASLASVRPNAPASSAAPASTASRSAPAASANTASTAPSASASTAAAPTSRRLPKTASPLPLIGLAGAAALVAGLILRVRRLHL